MAVRLSSYLWFRRTLLDTLDCPQHMDYPKFSDEDAKGLRSILEEIDALQDYEAEYNPKPIIGPNVVLPGCTEVKEHCSDREKALELYEQIHGIIQNYWIKTGWYKEFARCFDELGLEPSEDLGSALQYAKDKCMWDHIRRRKRSLDKMCWDTIRDHKMRGL